MPKVKQTKIARAAKALLDAMREEKADSLTMPASERSVRSEMGFMARQVTAQMGPDGTVCARKEQKEGRVS